MSAAQTFDIYLRSGRRWVIVHNEPTERLARLALGRLAAEYGKLRLVHRTVAGERELAV